jgi:hypothetical protein
VILALAWSSVVTTARSNRGGVEAVDGLVVRRLKGEVEASGRLGVVAHEELVCGERTIALPGEVSAEGVQHRAVELLARLEIGDAYVDVVK